MTCPQNGAHGTRGLPARRRVDEVIRRDSARAVVDAGVHDLVCVGAVRPVRPTPVRYVLRPTECAAVVSTETTVKSNLPGEGWFRDITYLLFNPARRFII